MKPWDYIDIAAIAVVAAFIAWVVILVITW